MPTNRRVFIKKSLFVGLVSLIPLPVAKVARFLAPTVTRGPLYVSIGTLRPGWTVMAAAITTRLAVLRTAAIAAGAAAGAALKAAFAMGGRATWFDPRLCPSLRSVITGKVR
jgi:hypothetical protein